MHCPNCISSLSLRKQLVQRRKAHFKIKKMNKVKAWLLIIICSIFAVVFIIFFIAIIPGILSGKNANMSVKEMISSSIGFSVVIYLIIYGLKKGVKEIFSNRKREKIDFNETLNIEFNGQIKYNDYKKLMLNLRYNKPIYILIAGILILFSLSLFVNGPEILKTNNYFPFIAIGVLILSPFLSLQKIKRTYDSHKILQEKLTYKINNTSIQITGSTVNSTQYWNHFHKIRETSNFLILCQGESTATLIDKKMLSKTDLIKFNNFLSSLDIT